MLQRPFSLHMLLLKRCKTQKICKCGLQNVASTVQLTDFSCNMLQTPCKYVQCAGGNFNMSQIRCHVQLCASESRKVASNLQLLISFNFKLLQIPCGLQVRIAKCCQPQYAVRPMQSMCLVSTCCKHSPVYVFFLLHNAAKLKHGLKMLVLKCCKHHAICRD